MPPLTTENASDLCGGVHSKEKEMKAPKANAQPEILKVKVLRNFQDHRRQILKADTEATLPRLFALEMQAANKVTILTDEPEKEPAEPVKDPAEDKTKAGKKGDRNAR